MTRVSSSCGAPIGYSPPGGFSDGELVSRFPLCRCCDPVAFSLGLVASDGARSVADRDSVSPRPPGGGLVPSRPSLLPRVPSVGEVPVAPPRVLGEAVSRALPPRVPCGLVAAVAPRIFLDPRVIEHRRVIDAIPINGDCKFANIRCRRICSPWNRNHFAAATNARPASAGGKNSISHAARIAVEHDVFDDANFFTLG